MNRGTLGAAALWWHVYPLGMLGAPHAREDEVQHRLPNLINWLDHLIELGLNGLALGPIFDSATHGYDTLDHFAIDPRLGDLDDFHALVTACRERGIEIMLDGVFNHVADTHPSFVAALENGPQSAEAQLFRIYFDQSRPDGRPEYEHFEGHSQLASLNHANPAVVDYVASVMTHWLDEGITAWRLDAAYAVPTEFWRQVIDRVHETHPDAYVVGEVIHGDYPIFVTESGVDAVTQYELWKSIWSSLNDVNFHELAWNLQRNNDFLDTFTPWTFVGNHDVTRIASQLNDPAKLAIAYVLLYTLGGTPALYYGDEYGLLGVKEERVGGDDAIRPTFADNPYSDEVPFETGTPAAQLVQLIRELVALRRRHAWLQNARSEAVLVTNGQLILRMHDETHQLWVAANLDDTALELSTEIGEMSHILAGRGYQEGLIQPQGWAVASQEGDAR